MTVMAITDPPVLKATDCTCSRPAVSELLVSSSGVRSPAVAETLPRVRRRLPQSPIACVTSWSLAAMRCSWLRSLSP